MRMTESQLASVLDAIRTLESVHLDESNFYIIKSQSDKGESSEYVNREKYLEYIIYFLFEDLSWNFRKFLDDES